MRNRNAAGTPALDPRLTPRQLWALANEPGWWPWLDLIADHPNAWPELTDWAADARECGVEIAGDAPMPPALQKRKPLGALASALLAPRRLPSPPYDTDDDLDNGDVIPVVDDAIGQSDGAESALDRLDECAEPAMPEPAVDTEPSGRAKGAVSRGRLRIAVATVSAAALTMAGVMAWKSYEARRQAEALASAVSECGEAYDTAKAARRSYLAALADDATVTLSRLDRDKVSNAGTIDALSALLNDDAPAPTRCPANGTMDRLGRVMQANRRTASDMKAAEQRLRTAVDAVESSRLSKTLADATALYDASAGKVDDESTRTALKTAIDSGKEQRIREAVGKVNASMQAKSEKDEKARAEAEAAAQAQARQQPQDPQPSYVPQYAPQPPSGGTASGGAGGGQQAGNPGWDVPAQSDPDPFAGTDPSL